MDEIKTEQQFKMCLLQCVRYMTKVGDSKSVEMDLGEITIGLILKKNSHG